MFESAGKLGPGIRGRVMAAVADVKTVGLKSMASLVVKSRRRIAGKGGYNI